MGQNQSGESSPNSSWNLLQKHGKQFKNVVSISYAEFLVSLKEINDLSKTFSDTNGLQLQFQLKKNTDQTIFWKGTVRIRCCKIAPATSEVVNCRLLNLKQYLHLYNEIIRQATTSTLQHNQDVVDNVEIGGEEHETEECCICMERKSELSLPCSHCYCEKCLSTWNIQQKTCPICRSAVESSTKDCWLLAEKPDEAEMISQNTCYLMSLADSSGTPLVYLPSPQDQVIKSSSGSTLGPDTPDSTDISPVHLSTTVDESENLNSCSVSEPTTSSSIDSNMSESEHALSSEAEAASVSDDTNPSFPISSFPISHAEHSTAAESTDPNLNVEVQSNLTD